MPMPKLLTIDGETRNVKDWSKVSGVDYATILKRLRVMDWPPKAAVFAPIRSQPRVRRRIPLRAALALSPSPHLATPLRPTCGSVRSYPIDALGILRRIA